MHLQDWQLTEEITMYEIDPAQAAACLQERRAVDAMVVANLKQSRS